MIPTQSRKIGHTLGFTLVELMVAVAVTTVLVLMLATVLGSIGETTAKTTGRIEAEREARSIFEAMERDLSSTIVLSESDWLRILDDPDADPDPWGTDKPDWLLMLATPLDHDLATSGDVCLISYRLAKPTFPTGEAFVPSLHRLVIPAKETFKDALAVSNLYTDFMESRESTNPESGALGSWFGAGVIDMQVSWPVAGDASKLTVSIDVLTRRGQALYDEVPDDVLRSEEVYRFVRHISLPVLSD